jgi:hypothetical protein
LHYSPSYAPLTPLPSWHCYWRPGIKFDFKTFIPNKYIFQVNKIVTYRRKHLCYKSHLLISVFPHHHLMTYYFGIERRCIEHSNSLQLSFRTGMVLPLCICKIRALNRCSSTYVRYRAVIYFNLIWYLRIYLPLICLNLLSYLHTYVTKKRLIHACTHIHEIIQDYTCLL